MGFFGFGKKKDVLDLTERYKRQQEKISEIEGENSGGVSDTDSGSSALGGFGVFGSMASANSSSASGSSTGGYMDVSSGVEDKRKKLAKRIMAMTEKLEDLGNQIYHLQQRIEVLEKKSGTNRF
jgi:chromosome segregation ATPase